MKIIPYKIGSASAKELAGVLGIKRVNRNKAEAFRANILINWGCPVIDRPHKVKQIINIPEAVKKASNKLATFKTLEGAGVSIPNWTEGQEEAIKWLTEGFDVVVRHKLNGHSGEGVEIIFGEKNNPNFDHTVPKAPLYVKYVPKKEEYRIHVFNEEVIFVQRKARKLEVPDDKINWKVRNLNGGFIFANDGVVVSDEAKKQAIMAVKALGLHFGAVDIIWNQKHNKFYVLEVNTAPGLAGKTLDAYKEKFNGLAA